MPLLFLGIKDRLFYGWVVVIAGLIIGTILLGARTSFGVFFPSLQGEFGLSRGVTSAVFSVYMVLAGVLSIFWGWVLDRHGPRIVALIMGVFTGLSLLLTSQTDASWQLFISYSLLLAIGTGGINIAVMSTVSRWFSQKRGLAVGIAGSGGGLGLLIMSPFAAYLIANFGWRMSYVVMGLIVWLVVTSLSLLLKKDPRDVGLLPDGVKPNASSIEVPAGEDHTQTAGLSLLEAFRDSRFWFLWFTWLLQSWSAHLVATHIVPRATDVGISTMKAAVVLSLIGGFNVTGRVLAGRTSDIIGRKVVSVICALLGAVALLWLVWAQDLWAFYLFAVFFGLSWGGLGTVVPSLVADIFGLRSLGAIMGAQNVAWVLGGAIGPLIGGFVFDATNTYSIAFLAGAAAMLIAALLVALLRQETSKNM